MLRNIQESFCHLNYIDRTKIIKFFLILYLINHFQKTKLVLLRGLIFALILFYPYVKTNSLRFKNYHHLYKLCFLFLNQNFLIVYCEFLFLIQVMLMYQKLLI
jgi:hypothetical protein